MLRNIFKRKEIEVKKETDTVPAYMMDEYSKIEILKGLNASIQLDKLFNITQEAKKELGYVTLSNSDKYLLEKFQDIILYLAKHNDKLPK